MNEEAVKELTKQGCIVEKDAAESLEERDVQVIRQLDSMPMYLSRKMVEKLREKQANGSSSNSRGGPSRGSSNIEPNGSASPSSELEPNGTSSESVEQEERKDDREQDDTGEQAEESIENAQELDSDTETEDSSDSTEFSTDSEKENDVKSSEDTTVSEPEEKKIEGLETAGDKFSNSKTVTIRDSRRTAVSTKVEVLDEAEITKQEKDVPEFLACYNDRYEKLKKMLMRRTELKSAVSIQRLERRDEGEQAAIIGFVNDKYSTNSGKYIVELEDKTGSFKALVDERDGDRIVPDEVLGLSGSMGGDILYADSVIRPDMPIPDGTNSTEQKIKGAYISDMHLGSVDTLYERFDRFAKWLNTDAASDIGYLVIPGDPVEGVGIYPDQDEELRVTNIYEQYQMFEEWIKKLPEDLQVVVGPGNHDIVRMAEPQPRLPEKALSEVVSYDNVHLVQNPQYVNLHGIESSGLMHLMYHGYSFDSHVDQIKELREKAYDEPHHVMIDLLKRRHLAPTFGSNLLAPEGEDHLVIDRKPDVMASGHFHSHAVDNYKGVTTICASTFQAQTDFQKRVGHTPDPGKVTIHDFKTRKSEVKQF